MAPYCQYLMLIYFFIYKKHTVNIWIQGKNYYNRAWLKVWLAPYKPFHSWHWVFSNIVLVHIESTVLYYVFAYLYSEASLQVIRHYLCCYLWFKVAGIAIHIQLFCLLKIVSVIIPKTVLTERGFVLCNLFRKLNLTICSNVFMFCFVFCLGNHC